MPANFRNRRNLQVENGGTRAGRSDGVNAWICGSSLMTAHPMEPVKPVVALPQPEPIEEISPVVPTFSTEKASGRSWAEEVEEELFSGKSPVGEGPSIPTSEPLEINGVTYKYTGSRPPLLFSPDDPDARYRYEDEPSASTASPSSDASEPPPWISAHNNRIPAKSGGLNPQYWYPKPKSRKRNKKHTQTTPGLRPEWEYYEAQAADDPLEGSLPTVEKTLERVDSAPVVEDLWADYHNQPPLPLYLG